MRLRVLVLAVAFLTAAARAEYVDPYGLPSGSAELALATQAAILSGASVEGYDFAGPELIEAPYVDQVAAGLVDLLFVELSAENDTLYLRAPEGADQFDRFFIADLGPVDLAEVDSMEDVELTSHVPATLGDTYVLLQFRENAQPEITAVKFRVTGLEAASVHFDWAWQPNGSLYFVPSAAEPLSFGELKPRW